MIILILALGIGVSTAMFSAVQAVLLAPLPYPDAERVVVISTELDETVRVEPRVSGGDAADLAESAAFGAFAYHFGGEIGVQVKGQGTFAGVTFAPPSFFDVLGVEAEAGRLYDSVDAGGSAVVSAGFAGRVFGSASGALGQTIGVEQQAIEIVGVVPAWVDYPAESEVWVAAPAIPRMADRAALRMRTVARVAEGLTAEEAREALDVTSRDLARAYPETNARRRFTMEPLATHIAGPAAATLLFLFASTGVLLLIACINVSTLTLGRIGARTREIGIRLALGASRGRVLRELWVETSMVALAGAALAVPVAAALIHGLSVVAPSVVPRADALAINGTVLGFVAAAAALASIVCTLAPAWQISRLDVCSGPFGTIARPRPAASLGSWDSPCGLVGLGASRASWIRSEAVQSRGSDERRESQESQERSDSQRTK